MIAGDAFLRIENFFQIISVKSNSKPENISAIILLPLSIFWNRLNWCNSTPVNGRKCAMFVPLINLICREFWKKSWNIRLYVTMWGASVGEYDSRQSWLAKIENWQIIALCIKSDSLSRNKKIYDTLAWSINKPLDKILIESNFGSRINSFNYTYHFSCS